MYCVISDLHGRLEILEKIISKYPNHHLIILGDTIHHKRFFSKRIAKTNPVRMLNLLMGLKSSGKADIIMGNNEKYLINNFVNPLETIGLREARFTLKKIRELSANTRLEIFKWLSDLPVSLEVDNYRFAHAYYNDSHPAVVGPGYDWYLPVYDDLHKLDENFFYFFGHYGKPYFRKNIRVLDCTELEGVGVYILPTHEFSVFN